MKKNANIVGVIQRDKVNHSLPYLRTLQEAVSTLKYSEVYISQRI